MSYRFLPVFAFLPLLFGQDLPQRSRLSDYPVRAQLQHFEIGAYYLVHDIPSEKAKYSANDYLVVEIAVFPASGEHPRISSRDFMLRVNDKKTLNAASPQSVAVALRSSDLNQSSNFPPEGGIGSQSPIVQPPQVAGVPPDAGRFPEDGNPDGNLSARGPFSRNTGDPYSAQERAMAIDRAIDSVAFPVGVLKQPVKGDLFFRFSGKLKSIRSLDLVYTDENGFQTALPLVKVPEK